MKKLKVWQQGLLHGFLLWMFFYLNDAISHWYEVQQNGPYLFNSDGSPVTLWQGFVDMNYYQKIWINFLVISYFVELGYHLVFKRETLRKYLMVLIPGAALLILLNGWRLIYKHGEAHTFTFTAPFLALSAYSLIYAFLRDYFHKRQEEKTRSLQQKESEIKALKAQVNPHFFFNTLNTIYGTALQENAPRTANCIEQLSAIMRYTITETGRDLTPLAEEVNFIEDYLHLQKLRIPARENIRVETDISIDDPSVSIAPLLLLPFIENAFKYGISTDRPCRIKITLNVQNKVLHFRAENTLFPDKNKPTGLGTGIENTRQRLELIYPGRHQLVYGPQENNFLVLLTLHLN